MAELEVGEDLKQREDGESFQQARLAAIFKEA
jgi:hypothetical protein